LRKFFIKRRINRNYASQLADCGSSFVLRRHNIIFNLGNSFFRMFIINKKYLFKPFKVVGKPTEYPPPRLIKLNNDKKSKFILFEGFAIFKLPSNGSLLQKIFFLFFILQNGREIDSYIWIDLHFENCNLKNQFLDVFLFYLNVFS